MTGRYEESLEQMCDKLWKGLEFTNKTYGTKHGFIGLLIRDPSLSNIDIMHNVKNKEDLIVIFELTLKQLKKER